MKTYRLKVTIIGMPRLYRVIDFSENCTFDDLHHALFDFFGRDDPHLYSFFITKADSRNMRTITRAPEITDPHNLEEMMGFARNTKSASQTTIGAVGLAEKDVFHYLFDFGDEWWHRIRVEKIIEGGAVRKGVHLIKAVGESPPQYDDDEDYF
ncbi:MAG: plasmid pRiA4b ORF-3 family protein [Desulfobulbaceae bacterium]|nr:plasmid pRiA4b ORF-3 family protein [Desulfobulbaceae bacterium]